MSDFSFSWLEWFGFVSAIIYLYFSVNQKIWLWPMGIVSSLFYMIVFYYTRLYADMILQLYYLVVSIWGWIFWHDRQIDEGNEKIKIQKVTNKTYIRLLVAFCILYVLLAYLLLTVPSALNITASDMPYWDAFTTAGSFVATWMLVKKIIEQWLIWIIIDSVAMGMYMYKGLYFTAFLFLVYSVMAAWGYFAWLKDIKKQSVFAD